MTDEQIAVIEERTNAATKGPWHVSGDLGNYIPFEISSPYDDHWISHVQNHENCYATPEGDANAEFIAHARTDVPDLIAALRLSLQRISELEKPLIAILSGHLSKPNNTGLEWCKHCEHCFIAGRGAEIKHALDCVIPSIRLALAVAECSQNPTRSKPEHVAMESTGRKCLKCKDQGHVCSQTQMPWCDCDCSYCERGPSTRVVCSECVKNT